MELTTKQFANEVDAMIEERINELKKYINIARLQIKRASGKNYNKLSDIIEKCTLELKQLTE